MKIKDLIRKIEQSDHFDGQYQRPIKEYLKKLKQQDPNDLVMWNNGECDREGIFIPYDKEGREVAPPRHFNEGDVFPNDDYDWVRVG